MENRKILWYKNPAKEFVEALPVGNGRLGGMVYGGTGKEKISLNEDTLWSGYPKDKSIENAYQGILEARAFLQKGKVKECENVLWQKCLSNWTEAYQPAGDIYIESCDVLEVYEYYRALDIKNAVSITRFKSNGFSYNREVIATNPKNLIIIKQTTDNQNAKFVISLNSPHKHKYVESKDELTILGLSPYLSQPSYHQCEEPIKYDDFDNNRALTYSIVVKPVLNGGSYKMINNCLEIHSSDFVLFLDVSTNFEGFDKQPGNSKIDPIRVSKERIKKAEKISYQDLKQEHIRDYNHLFDRAELTLFGNDKFHLSTDERLKEYLNDKSDVGLPVLLFDYGRYLTIASSRENTQAMNLQGIWNEELRAPWSSNYTININAQMNYWHVEASNLSECHKPFLQLIKELAVNGEKTAKNNYHCRGWCSHHNTDLWRQSEPVGKEAYDSGSVGYGFWNVSGGWLSRHIWEHFEYTNDIDFLKEYWGVIKGSTLFFLDWLIEDKDGYYITPLSTSPENKYLLNSRPCSVSQGSAMDIGIINELFSSFIKGSQILDMDLDIAAEVKKKLALLKPYEIGKRGNIIEFDKDYEEAEPNHRHLSLLYGLYPGTSMNTDKLKKASEVTMKLRGDDATGWGLAWKINVWARLGNGNKAKFFIDQILRPVTNCGYEYASGGGVYPNLFDAHPPFQIDGNFGVTAGIIEMLLQNTQDGIALLPALPDEWKSGKVRGFKVKGNEEIDFEWENGQITYLKKR